MDSCPACTASLQRNVKAHCEDHDCGWMVCTRCKCIIDYLSRAYFRGGSLWGNEDGYIKTTEA